MHNGVFDLKLTQTQLCFLTEGMAFYVNYSSHSLQQLCIGV